MAAAIALMFFGSAALGLFFMMGYMTGWRAHRYEAQKERHTR